MKAAELFKPDFEQFDREASMRDLLVTHLKEHKFPELSQMDRMDESGRTLLWKIICGMAERLEAEAGILRKAVETRSDGDIEDALVILYRDVPRSER